MTETRSQKQWKKKIEHKMASTEKLQKNADMTCCVKYVIYDSEYSISLL